MLSSKFTPMKTILTLVLFSITFYSTACLNLSGTNIDGEFNSIDMLDPLHEPTNYPSKHSIYMDLARLFDNYEDRGHQFKKAVKSSSQK